MTPRVDDLLTQIGTELAKFVPQTWVRAGIEIEMTDGAIHGPRLWSSTRTDTAERTNLGRFGIDLKPLRTAFREMRERFRSTPEGPWYRAMFVMTPEGKFSIDFEYDNLRMEWQNRLNAATEVRVQAYALMGEVDDDVIAPMVGATFTGNAEWPCRPGWRVARGRMGLAVISDGLSDPYEDREGPGLGVEVYMQTKEKLLKRRAPIRDVTETWLFSAVADVCNTIAAHGGIPELLDKERYLSIEVDGSRFPEALHNDDGRVGVLLGIPAKGVPDQIHLAEGTARLVAITLLTRAELEYVTGGGRDARIEVAERLAKKVGHVSTTKRDSVV